MSAIAGALLPRIARPEPVSGGVMAATLHTSEEAADIHSSARGSGPCEVPEFFPNLGPLALEVGSFHTPLVSYPTWPGKTAASDVSTQLRA